MKRGFSLLLALLMLALPVFSLAETADSSAPFTVPGLRNPDFAGKYLAEGQAKVTTVSFATGDLLPSLLGEEMAGPITDLLAALSFQSKHQSSGEESQASFALQLNGEDTLCGTVATSKEGLFATSNLLGEEIYQLTNEDLKTLGEQFIQSQVEQGKLSQEMVDSAKEWFTTFQNDPQAAILSLIGEVDLTGIQASLNTFLASLSMGAVTEAPEKLPDATTMITVPLKKADLSALMEEIAKVIWNMPIVQKLAPSVTTSSGTPLTQESLTAGLRKFPDALAEDTELRIYTGESGKIYLTLPMKLTAEDKIVDTAFEMLLSVEAEGFTMDWVMNAAQENEKVVLSGNFVMAGNHLDYTVTADVTEADGQTWRPIEEIISADIVSEETSFSINANITARIVSEAGAPATGLVFTVSKLDQDLGDHAEGTASITVSLENMGELLTVHVAEVTTMAEAYIDNAEIAVKPMAMSPEEQTALVEKIQGNLQLTLVTALQKLPASVLQIVSTFMQ